MGTGEEGMCESQLFSDRGLLSVLLDAIDYFKKGSLYEIAVQVHTPHGVDIPYYARGGVEALTRPCDCLQVYKIVLPVYEATRDYRALSKAHADLQAIFMDIASAVRRTVLPCPLLKDNRTDLPGDEERAAEPHVGQLLSCGILRGSVR